MGILYVVATPIGNLEDITLRAIRILQQVSLIAAEDTRHAQILKKQFGLSAPITSYYEHNKTIKNNIILKALREGDVALISDAGTPAISDPGVEIVRLARDNGFGVCPIAGPSALSAAISVCGIAAPYFLFLGFLPNQTKKRKTIWQRLHSEEAATIFFESPHSLLNTLNEMAQELGPSRFVVILRELTKHFEEIWQGDIADAITWAKDKKGEIVIVLSPTKTTPGIVTDQSLAILKEMKKAGLGAKKTADKAAEQTGLSKKELYRQYLSLQ